MSSPTELRHQLRVCGFAPIPLYGKQPPAYGKNNERKSLNGWEKLTEVGGELIDMWDKTWPDATNTGCLTRLMPTLDLDIHNEKAVQAIEDFIRRRYEGKGRVLVRIGRAPRRAIPFRTNQPFKKIKVLLAGPNTEPDEKIEVLGDGQQVVVDGIHPDIPQPYVWPGGELWRVKREDLPLIDGVEAQQLVEDVLKLLDDFDIHRKKKQPSKQRKGEAEESRTDDWAALLENIDEGNDYHDTLCKFAAKLIRSGMNGGAATNFLRDVMRKSRAPHDDRWKARYRDIVRAVATAEAMLEREREERERKAEEQKPAPAPRTLLEVHATFVRWFGEEYDLDSLDATLAVSASERLSGDPVWLNIVSGPGNAKTETVQSTSKLKTEIVSTISSEGALLSASQIKKRRATGGLLRKIGERGILVIKDFTSILSAKDREARADILSALREIYDGKWVRHVGSDGGQTLEWHGRLVVIAACTSAWDTAHAVIGKLGDRFVLIRPSSRSGRISGGQHAIQNTGSEQIMRRELAEAVAGLISNVDFTNAYELTPKDRNTILNAADLVTRARTGVERSLRGDVIDAHDPEMPTRFTKQLTQIMRGGVAIGMEHEAALRLVLRCARDSVPQLRLALLIDLSHYPGSSIMEIRRRLQRPRQTVDRGLQELHVLGLAICDERPEQMPDGKKIYHRFYSLSEGTDPKVLQPPNERRES